MGPLAGLRVIEMEAIGPLLHAGMMLADLGADVVRVVRPSAGAAEDGVDDANAGMLRGRTQVGLNLKGAADRELFLELVAGADVLLEGLRPGAMEGLGLGPEDCRKVNPSLVYGRMSGWGQTGPMAAFAGHDINYLALAGALDPMGPADSPPLPPLNYVGNFGGGSMFLLFGVMVALQERTRTGQGQVVDAAMVDGASSLTSLLRSWEHTGRWSDQRGTNLLDGSAPYYRAYACADGRHMAVGALEATFYDRFVEGLGLATTELPDRWDRDSWPTLSEAFATTFASRTREEWTEVFSGIDACVTPVLTLAESLQHPQAVARSAFVEIHGLALPAPAPRLSGTSPELRPLVHGDASEVAAAWCTAFPGGLDADHD